MRGAVYLIFLALLLLELAIVDGKCIGSKCKSLSSKASKMSSKVSAMRQCASSCEKCRDPTSCKKAQSACDRAKAGVKCVAPKAPKPPKGPPPKPSCAQKCAECQKIKYNKPRLQCSLYNGKTYCRSNGGKCPANGRPKGMADMLDLDGNDNVEEPIDSTAGLMAIKVSKPVLYVIVAVVMLLLIANISCLFYVNCIKRRRKKIMYAKVDVIGSSDDDMENLKRVEI